MNLTILKEKLFEIDQPHLLDGWEKLSIHSKSLLAKQIESLDIPTFLKQKQLILNIKSNPFEKNQFHFTPFDRYQRSGNFMNFTFGKKLIAEGRLGCLIIAGGQGTRLDSRGPKGAYPVSIIKQKSLFQLFAEKTLAASKQAQTELPLAIMTSPLNHDETLTFFEQHHYFGLSSHQISFYSQEMLPFLNQNGLLFLESPDQIARGPSGNGMSLNDFYKSGIWKKWNEQGVSYLNYVLIDNPLADPYDAELIGFHSTNQLDITIKCIARENPDEKVGILVNNKGKAQVVEYTEFPEEERQARLANAQLKYPIANTSLFCFSMDFIRTISEETEELPLHANLKAATAFKNNKIDKELAWKFETFIFDLLPLTGKVNALLYPREECFSPLKNATGEASLQAVQNALQAKDRRIFEEIASLPSPAYPFELSQEFHYPTKELLKKWHKKIPPGSANYFD